MDLVVVDMAPILWEDPFIPHSKTNPTVQNLTGPCVPWEILWKMVRN